MGLLLSSRRIGSIVQVSGTDRIAVLTWTFLCSWTEGQRAGPYQVVFIYGC